MNPQITLSQKNNLWIRTMNTPGKRLLGVAQLKTGMTSPQVRRPVAPPVYRPQPTPKVLQCKSAPVRSLLPVNQKWPNTGTIQRSAPALTTPVDDKKEEKKPDPAQVLREQGAIDAAKLDAMNVLLKKEE
jgi:hypothetical protein